MKPKTYILKHDVYNSIDFPAGTVVKVIDPNWEFEVVAGKLKGKRGNIADGLNGWLLENNAINKKLLKQFKAKEREVNNYIKLLNKEWSSLPSVRFQTKNK